MEWYFYLIIAIAAVIVIAALVIVLVKVNKSRKIKQADQAVDEKVEQSASALALCFGGNDNIKEIKTMGSRVTVVLEDMSKVKKDEIDKELSNVMYMGNKVVFVIGSKSEDFSRLLQENIEKTK